MPRRSSQFPVLALVSMLLLGIAGCGGPSNLDAEVDDLAASPSPSSAISSTAARTPAATAESSKAANSDKAARSDKKPVTTAASRTIRFRVVNATGQLLTVKSVHLVYGSWRGGEEPAVGDVIYQLDTMDYTLEGNGLNGAEGDVTYQIGQTNEVVRVSGLNPYIGANKGSCDSSKDPSYRCEQRVGGGNDNNIDSVVTPKTAASHILTDTTTPSRRDAVDGLCSSQGGLPAKVTCTAETLDNITARLGAAQPASSTLVNCGSVTNSIRVAASYSVSETNTIGVTLEAQIKLSEAWTQKVATTYQHSWTTTRTNTETVTLNVPAGRYGYISARPGMIAITGDYTLKAGNQTYTIGSFTVVQPATEQWLAKNPSWKDIVVPADFAMDRDEVCDGRTSGFERPRPADVKAGGTYNVAMANANQWALTVPNRSHELGARIVLDNLANGSGRNQKWTLVPLQGQPAGDWQLASANTPNLCLQAQRTTGNATINQADCMAPNNYDLGMQVWRLEYDPSLGGYELIQPYSTKRLALTEETISSGQHVWAVRDHLITNRSRWELNITR